MMYLLSLAGLSNQPLVVILLEFLILVFSKVVLLLIKGI
jgi:hypothetical protein